ncbi:MAG: thiol:disulfide interchange protein DsbA/DsbL [Burkholderiales bacterium]|nr:thiol:disulfide interchange protein DsbA/DsbL [Burkholderiales bacterium]
MTIDRRHFLAAGAAAALAAPAARAQRRPPDAGIDYKVLDVAQPVETAGKIEVMEFFWYGCPHCNAFEAPLSAWTKKAPADVAFRRLPAQFNAVWAQHARLYYALEAIGEVERVHRKVFDAIHVEQQRLSDEGEMIAWGSKNGIDRDKFGEALRSQPVANRMAVARQTLIAYRIDGVPAMAVAGRYLTAPSIVGSHERCLQVVDFLIEQERRARRA